MFDDFLRACHLGDVKMVSSLINKVDPSSEYNLSIRTACYNGHLDVVKLLLADSRVDPSDNFNGAIMLASRGGHIDIVRLLLDDSRVDPSVRGDYAIRLANRKGYTEIVQLLTEHQFRLDGPEYNKNILT